jgi:hypothetical protein
MERGAAPTRVMIPFCDMFLFCSYLLKRRKILTLHTGVYRLGRPTTQRSAARWTVANGSADAPDTKADGMIGYLDFQRRMVAIEA